MNKEQIYDAEIAPLMSKIIEVCREHKIGMLASFALPIPGDEGLHCTTHLPDDTGELPELLRVPAAHILRHRGLTPFFITTKYADGSSKLTAVLG